MRWTLLIMTIFAPLRTHTLVLLVGLARDVERTAIASASLHEMSNELSELTKRLSV